MVLELTATVRCAEVEDCALVAAFEAAKAEESQVAAELAAAEALLQVAMERHEAANVADSMKFDGFESFDDDAHDHGSDIAEVTEEERWRAVLGPSTRELREFIKVHAEQHGTAGFVWDNLDEAPASPHSKKWHSPIQQQMKNFAC